MTTSRLRSERGAEIIELAMVTPILLLLLGAIVDFGFVFRSWEVVTNAAREGARVGILPNSTCTATGSTDPLQQRVEAYLNSSGIAGATIEAQQTFDAVNNINVCTVRVAMSQPLPSLGIFGQFVGGGFTTVQVAGGATMRTEVQAP